MAEMLRLTKIQLMKCIKSAEVASLDQVAAVRDVEPLDLNPFAGFNVIF